MQVERYEINGRHIYRIHSDYAKDSVAVTPKELMELLTWLQEHEAQITQDRISNRSMLEMMHPEYEQ